MGNTCHCYCNNRGANRRSSRQNSNSNTAAAAAAGANRNSSVSNNFSSISSGDQQHHHHHNLQQIAGSNGNFLLTTVDTISLNNVPTGRNKRLKKDKCKWKSDVSINEQELEAKRDEFWDTAPAFGGRIEIWNALKAVCSAIDASQNYELAQVIIDSAQIILPNGSLNDCYDELGNHYQLPNYVIQRPVNLKKGGNKQAASVPAQVVVVSTANTTVTTAADTSLTTNPVTTTTDNNQGQEVAATKQPHQDIQLKFRLSNSLNSSDLKLIVNLNSTIDDVKNRIKELKQIETYRQRMYFGGKLLVDRIRLKDLKLQKNFVIQVIVRDDPLQQ